jgi:CRISPR type III-associated protein (TIGR04423 family)
MESINDIPKGIYEGYIWYSDRNMPIVIQGEEFCFNEKESVNPFVIEALLFDRANQISITIKHTGRYIIQIVDLKNLPERSVLSECKEYFPHRLGKNVSKMCFKQLWVPEPDRNCEGMNVLNMKAFIFTGFKY